MKAFTRQRAILSGANAMTDDLITGLQRRQDCLIRTR